MGGLRDTRRKSRGGGVGRDKSVEGSGVGGIILGMVGRRSRG